MTIDSSAAVRPPKQARSRETLARILEATETLLAGQIQEYRTETLWVGLQPDRFLDRNIVGLKPDLQRIGRDIRRTQRDR